MIPIENDPNEKFERSMFNLLRNFNFIDSNLGLCISFLAEPTSPSKAYKKLASISFDQRLKWLKSLLVDEDRKFSEEGKREFIDWFSDADEVRKLRNFYVHSNWHFNPTIEGMIVYISAPVWMEDKLGGERTQEMKLTQLADKVIMVEKVFNDFMDLRTKYNI